jgi:hypothetical protein
MQFIFKHFQKSISATLFLCIATILTACGGGSSSGSPHTSVSALSLSPQTVQFDKGDSYQFTASLSTPGGTPEDVSEKVTWTSSDESVVTVDASGLASGLSAGTATITVTYQAKKAYTVTDGVVINETEPSSTQANEESVSASTYSPSGTVSNRKTETTATESTLTSTDKQGLSNDALNQLITNETTLVVSDAILESITLTPAITSIPAGYTVQYTATGIYSDDSTQDITEIVSWRADDSAASFSDTSGLVAISPNAADKQIQISASLGELNSNAAKLQITSAVLDSITIESLDTDHEEIPAGAERQFSAIGHFSDGTSLDLTQASSWSVIAELPQDVNADVGDVSNAPGSLGKLTSANPGTIVIAAQLGSHSAERSQTINDAVLTALYLSPETTAMPIDAVQQLSLIAYYSDDSSYDVTDSINTVWSSSDSDIASVNNTGKKGLATTEEKVGITDIAASYLDESAITSLTVAPANLIYISLNGTSALPVDTSQVFSATGHYSDGSSRDISEQVTWFSATGNAVLSNADGSQGLASGVNQGSDIVSARLAGIEASTALAITPE